MSRTDHDPNDEIRDLLVEAGPPDPIPADDLAAIQGAARDAFRAQADTPDIEGQSVTPIVEGQSLTPIVERPGFRRTLALAATLALAVTGAWLYLSRGTPVASTPVATVELLRGERAADTGLAPGAELAAGTEIDTRAARPVMVALRMPSGHSVRVHADSRLRLAAATRLELERGAVYVDSGLLAGEGLEIVTPLGSVRELGTQYEVRLGQEGTMRVRVREGSVSLRRDDESYSAGRGEQLTVEASGAVMRDQIEVAGDHWAWVKGVAPSFDTDGATVAAYLEWVGRETALEIVFADPGLEIDVARVMVVGRIDGLTPEASLDVVLPGSALGYRIEGDRLVITGPGG